MPAPKVSASTSRVRCPAAASSAAIPTAAVVVPGAPSGPHTTVLSPRAGLSRSAAGISVEELAAAGSDGSRSSEPRSSGTAGSAVAEAISGTGVSRAWRITSAEAEAGIVTSPQSPSPASAPMSTTAAPAERRVWTRERVRSGVGPTISTASARPPETVARTSESSKQLRTTVSPERLSSMRASTSPSSSPSRTTDHRALTAGSGTWARGSPGHPRRRPGSARAGPPPRPGPAR